MNVKHQCNDCDHRFVCTHNKKLKEFINIINEYAVDALFPLDDAEILCKCKYYKPEKTEIARFESV